MRYEQAYYTSCEHGRRGTPGFQINAASDGLGEGQLHLLERHALYKLPPSAPIQPTEEEIAQFPQSLLFFKLHHGAAAIARSVYLGRDYSGRFGNFFTHFVCHSDSETLVREIFPVSTLRSQFWVNEAANTIEIPPIELSAADTALSLRELCQTAGAAERREQLADFMISIVLAIATGKRMIIVDDSSESVALMIGAVSFLLPTNLLPELTFATYCYNPYNIDTLVCGTTTDSAFAFSSAEIQSQYLVFDFVKRRFSEPPVRPDWAKLCAERFISEDVTAITQSREEIQAEIADFVKKVNDGMWSSAIEEVKHDLPSVHPHASDLSEVRTEEDQVESMVLETKEEFDRSNLVSRFITKMKQLLQING